MDMTSTVTWQLLKSPSTGRAMAERLVYLILALSVIFNVVSSADQFYANTRYGKKNDIESGETLRFNARQSRNSQGKVDVTTRNDRFFIGSRYGKRTSAPSKDTVAEAEMPQVMDSSRMGRSSVTQRNDRFFLGSRYGKRAEQQIEKGQPKMEADLEYEVKGEKLLMDCTFTGVGNYFKCFPNQFDRSSK